MCHDDALYKFTFYLLTYLLQSPENAELEFDGLENAAQENKGLENDGL